MVRWSAEVQLNVRWMSGERQILIWAWHWWTWNIQDDIQDDVQDDIKTWDFKGGFKEDFEGDFEGYFRGLQEGDLEGEFKQDIEGDLLSSSGQVRSRSGLVQVSLQLKFNSFELDSEVGRLVQS